jgi:hypothetical protein
VADLTALPWTGATTCREICLGKGRDDDITSQSVTNWMLSMRKYVSNAKEPRR